MDNTEYGLVTQHVDPADNQMYLRAQVKTFKTKRGAIKHGLCMLQKDRKIFRFSLGELQPTEENSDEKKLVLTEPNYYIGRVLNKTQLYPLATHYTQVDALENNKQVYFFVQTILEKNIIMHPLREGDIVYNENHIQIFPREKIR